MQLRIIDDIVQTVGTIHRVLLRKRMEQTSTPMERAFVI